MDLPLLFYFSLLMISILYSSVGHGGASGYLALMALFGVETILMRPTALILNLFVAGISFYMYWKQGHFKWKLFFPFAFASVPASFIGGYMQLDPTIYKRILAILLVFSVIKMMGWNGKVSKEIKDNNLYLSLLVGLLIGFFSGLIGIGGGVILSPVILLLHWADMKTTAAVSALFIWINSFAALMGIMSHGWSIDWDVSILVVLAVIGGLTGAYLGSTRLNNIILQRILGVVVFIASIKLFLT